MNKLNSELLHDIIELMYESGNIRNAGQLIQANRRLRNVGKSSVYIQHPKMLYNQDVLERKLRGTRWARYPATQPKYYRNNQVWNINRHCNCPITKQAYHNQIARQKKQANDKKKQANNKKKQANNKKKKLANNKTTKQTGK